MSAGVYLPNQGRIVRQVTFLAIAVLTLFGAYSLYMTLLGRFADSSPAMQSVEFVAPLALACVGLWVGYRLVNWPKFADFLIQVEAEMAKVTWPGKDELRRASIVVIVSIFILAISLFAFDLFWQGFFQAIGVSAA
ncbi:MAG: preprotein translocase subunit SecE [Planctomycetota bacterium]